MTLANLRGCGCEIGVLGDCTETIGGAVWVIDTDGIQVITRPCDRHRPAWNGVLDSLERARAMARYRPARHA